MESHLLILSHPKPHFERNIIGLWWNPHAQVWGRNNSHSFHRLLWDRTSERLRAVPGAIEAWDFITKNSWCLCEKAATYVTCRGVPCRGVHHQMGVTHQQLQEGTPRHSDQRRSQGDWLKCTSGPTHSLAWDKYKATLFPAQTSNEPLLFPTTQTSPVYILLTSQT